MLMFSWSIQLRESIRVEAYMYGLKSKPEHWDITCAGMRGISDLSGQWEAIKDG
jgi:hypothetical protein